MVIKDSEERNSKLAILRAHLTEGEAQAKNGEFVEDFSMEDLLTELDE